MRNGSYSNLFVDEAKIAGNISVSDIYLENTTVKVVRGNNVTIGSGCKIELVEYKNDFKQDEEAEICTYKKT